MPLGHQLGANDDIGLARSDGGNLRLERARTAKHIRAKRGNARMREKCGRLFAQPLDPGANSGQSPLDMAGGAGIGHGFGFAALVAQEAFQKPVLDHPRIAVIAADLVATGPAQRDRRIAAAIDEQKRLFARRNTRVYRRLQRRRNPALRRQGFGAHIDGLHLGQHTGAKAVGQNQLLVFARLGIGPSFQTGRGRGQHHPRAANTGAQHGHIAGVINHAFLLLVRGVVFFIHHNQPKVLIG